METRILFILSILIHFACTERFVFVNKYLDWTSAQTYCREKFTDLVTIFDNQENQKLMGVAENMNECIWIGLRHNSDNWRWSMGVPTSPVNKNDAIWDKDQPDNRQGVQNCATVYSAGVYDRECTASLESICFDGNATGKYILVSTKMTWPEAQTYCRTNHDDLASVRNEGEVQNLLDMFPKVTTSWAWIGLYRDTWSTWSDNRNTNFSNWETKPAIYLTDDHCGCLSAATGKWQDILCSTSKPFFCRGFYRDGQTQIMLKMKLQSGADLNNKEIQHQILEQIKNGLGPGGANLTVKWRATTKTTNPKPATNQTVPKKKKCDSYTFI